MDPKDADLARRFKVAIDEQAARGVGRAEASERRAIDVDAARAALFDRLVAFAGEVGAITARRDEESLTLAFGLRRVRFAGDDEGVAITFEGWPSIDVHRARPEPALEGRWVLDLRRHGREERFPLFDQGLEELLVHGLGLPRPSPTDRAMSPRTAAALSGKADTELPAAAARAAGTPRPPIEDEPTEVNVKTRKRDL